jgi:hypothetical protein
VACSQSGGSLLLIIQSGSFDSSSVVRLWVIVIVLSIIVTILGTILTHIVSAIIQAVSTNEEPKIEDIADERDQLIDLKGTRVAYSAFAIGVLLSMLTFALDRPPLVMFTLIIFLELWHRFLAIPRGSITTGEDSEMGKHQIRSNVRTLRFPNGEMTQQQLAEQLSMRNAVRPKFLEFNR